MSTPIAAAFAGDDSVALTEKIGAAAKRLEDIASDMAKAKDEDTARYQALRDEQAKTAATLTELKAKHDAEVRENEVKAAIEAAAEWRAIAANTRTPSKALSLGSSRSPNETKAGNFILGVAMRTARDFEEQAAGKAMLDDASYEKAWGKASLGTTDATGGWVIPNAIVDDFIRPAEVTNIYRTLMTVVPGVTAFAIDIPFRTNLQNRAVIAAFGATKENVDLSYNGYTVTMYTLARIHDIGNQFLRQSRGAAEADVMQSLGAAFAQGESYYIREGSGSSQPFGYTAALTNGPSAYRTSNPASLSDSTLQGSIAANIAAAAGAVASRGQKPTAAVLSASVYWQMLRQGSDNAGFWFATQERSPASIAPGTLVSPFGIPVYPDADADVEGTAAVIDNLVVANWKAFKVYFGENYRVDSSDVAGTRWDSNVTGFRGEEEMGFDARPAVYVGAAQLVTDVTP